MNRLKVLFITIFLMCVSFITCHASGDISLYLDGKLLKTDVPPVVEAERSFVPVRSIFEKMGAEVTWIGSRQQVIIRSVKARIVLNLDSKTAYVNNKAVELDVAPFALNGRTLVPVRFVSEELGYDVKWNGTDNSVHISTKGKVKEEAVSTVNNIEIAEKGGSSVITVTVSDMKKPKISHASDPVRFIADFANTALSLSGSKLAAGTDTVTEVRYAIHPDYTRVVIESPVEVTYSVKYTDTSMIVTVKAQDTDLKEQEEKEEEKVTIVDTNTVIDTSTLIVIDAGHGGTDCGAIGYDEAGNPLLYESEVNLAIALAVQEHLEAAGVSVLMTRSEDNALGNSEMEDLLARSAIANDAGAALFVSIHCNSFTEPSATGTEILYADTEDKVYNGITSKELATCILAPLAEATGLTNRGLKDSPKIVVLRTTTMPSVLIETAFMSNPGDLAMLGDKDKVDEIGYAISQGIVKAMDKLK